MGPAAAEVAAEALAVAPRTMAATEAQAACMAAAAQAAATQAEAERVERVARASKASSSLRTGTTDMKKHYILYIGIAVVVLALACGGYLLFRKSSAPDAAGSVFAAAGDNASTSAPIASGQTQPPPNSKQYENAQFHLSLYYPDDLTVTEEPVGGNSLVILFKDSGTQQGFEIFVTPYDQPKITQQRFLLDEPSGVMNDPQNITVDGAAATEFFSTNPAMGTSCEIWFLNNGYLYEVTTPEPLQSWLQQIMESWNFI
jgi:hypothetical protein